LVVSRRVVQWALIVMITFGTGLLDRESVDGKR